MSDAMTQKPARQASCFPYYIKISAAG